MENRTWNLYKGKKVRLFVIDNSKKIYPRDGVFEDYDNTHIFLKIDGKKIPSAFLKSTIKRVDLKNKD